MKKAFTLIELLIVLVIVGGLTTILFRSYTSISQLSVRIENEKVLSSETMLSQQFIQNLIEKNHIDFEQYSGENPLPLDDQGFTHILALTGDQQVSIYQTGDCINFTGDYAIFSSGMQQKSCRLEAQLNGQITQLTDPKLVYVSNTSFKLLPTQYYTGNVINYFNEKNVGKDYREFWHSQGIRILGHLWIRNYGEERTRNAHTPIQNFYHLGH